MAAVTAAAVTVAVDMVVVIVAADTWAVISREAVTRVEAGTPWIQVTPAEQCTRACRLWGLRTRAGEGTSQLRFTAEFRTAALPATVFQVT